MRDSVKRRVAIAVMFAVAQDLSWDELKDVIRLIKNARGWVWATYMEAVDYAKESLPQARKRKGIILKRLRY